MVTGSASAPLAANYTTRGRAVRSLKNPRSPASLRRPRGGYGGGRSRVEIIRDGLVFLQRVFPAIAGNGGKFSINPFRPFAEVVNAPP